MKEVTKEVFFNFINNYPNELTSGVVNFSEPPVRCYYDTTKGKGLDSIVATINMFEIYPKEGSEPYVWRPNKYRIEDNS